MGTYRKAVRGGRRRNSVPAAGAYLAALREVADETLWPTRCAVCGKPGAVLCRECERRLPYIDYWQACPSCGAPWGSRECTECNRLSLRGTGYDRFPLEGCVSVALFTDEVASIVRLRKDAGERRLSDEMGRLIAAVVPPSWARGAVVCFIPASRAARRKRGFDHGLELGRAVAERLQVPCAPLLERPCSRDQRKLSRDERFRNLAGAFSVRAHLPAPDRVIVVDDVLTTGATLFDAARALKAAGAEEVYGATFARVY